MAHRSVGCFGFVRVRGGIVQSVASLALLLALDLAGGAGLLVRDQELSTAQNAPIWVNVSANVSGAAGHVFQLTSLPQSGKGEVFEANPDVFASTGLLVQGRQITAGQLPHTLQAPPVVYYVPTPHEFSCSICLETNPSDCTVCVPYTSLAFRVLTKHGNEGGQKSTGQIDIIVKQNSDAPFTGGGGGALLLDGYDDFALARIRGLSPHAITVSLWVKCMRERGLQTVFSLMSDRGRELEVHNILDLQLLRGNTGVM